MERSSDHAIDGGDESSSVAKVIEWEDLEQELARFCSLSSALAKAKERKDSLSERLQSFIQEREASLRQLNELEEMKEKMEAQKLVMGDLLMRSKRALEDTTNQREQLCLATRLLRVAAKTLSAAHDKLEEANKLLSGEMGHGHLKSLWQMLWARQRHMIAQVAALYPVKGSIAQAPEEEGVVKKYSNSTSGNCEISHPSHVSRPPQMSSLSILGLQLTVPPLKRMTIFSDKKEGQRTAAALGYVAHAVLLIASYLDVPLRYPLNLGGSRSYIHDYAPSIELSSSDLASSSMNGLSSRLTEFPLFLEGQDTTRAAYAIFLLNKDLEQLLNYMGFQSLGPRHVLANLLELLRIIQSEEYIDK
ncbi:hypothetical protein QJS04_geneDACA015066 [Acorus gramineus]|uniref:UV radiation resistance-associated gene protein n=1 Tax=Acorus gramineus TaxID=55184 RepID=A0AAV9BV62_ACOGR|nr:hypothetical protein QJS04_geneDACA015066 [Acorus gramineus]